MCPFRIKKNTPWPPGKLAKIPFDEMKLGDSVSIKLTKEVKFGMIKQRVYRKNLKGKVRFSCYRIDDGYVRIFRIE